MPTEEHRAAQLLADAELFMAVSDGDVAAVYDRAAERYDHFRDLWLHLAGGGAEAAMLAGTSNRSRCRPPRSWSATCC